MSGGIEGFLDPGSMFCRHLNSRSLGPGGLGVSGGLEHLSFKGLLPSKTPPGTPGCGKAGERAGSTCAIDVKGHKRRPPSKVGGLCHEYRV